MSTAILSSAKSVPVTLDELRRLPAPKSQGPRHVPVPHADFVETVLGELKDRGYVATKQNLAVDHKGVRLFGAIDFMPLEKKAERLVGEKGAEGMSVGIRHANDRTISVGMVAGAKVFVCDNMVFAGDMVILRRKHTTRMDLDVEVSDAVDRLFEKYEALDLFVQRMKNAPLSDDQARLAIYEAVLEEQVVAAQYLPDIHGWYFDPPAGATDVEPRTAWGVYNAFTRVIRDFAPHRVQPSTMALTNWFGQEFGLN